jgi:hypothetical protein
MDSIAFPTFTVPTYKCCSLILTFDDIEEILSGSRIVQVGIGELEKNRHLFEDLKVNWLFSPKTWPVYASGFNPGISEPVQVFQFDVNDKCMQFSNSTGRSSMTYHEMVTVLSNTQSPSVSFACLPCEEAVDGETANVNSKSDKSKRRLNRRTQSLNDAMQAIKDSHGLKFVLPILSQDTAMVTADTVRQLADKAVGVSGSVDRIRILSSKQETGKKFVQIPYCEDIYAMLSAIKEVLELGTADVIETDLPFLTAKKGFLITNEFELEDLTLSSCFSNNDIIMDTTNLKVPRLVEQAALHTKSYIHHLFRCDELSGPIMLATVNLFQFDRLFRQYQQN